MYQIRYEKQIVYDPRLAAADLKYVLEEAKLHLATDIAGRLTFTANRHPMLSQFVRMSGIVDVRDGNEIIFRGRIVEDGRTFYGSTKVVCEEILACLNDSVVCPYSFPEDYLDNPEYQAAASTGNVVEYWLGELLKNHNSQVGVNQQIKLGSVTVSDPNNYIYRENSQYSTTWEVISQKLQKSALGGHLVLRYTDDDTYLDYLAEFPQTNIQRVQFAKNLLDMTDDCYSSQKCTAVLPIGKDGLTIDGLPDGVVPGYVHLQKTGKVLRDTKAIEGGCITKTVYWEDVGIPENLLGKAAYWLSNKGALLPTIIRCRACDLSSIDPVPAFRVGANVEVVSAPHGITGVYPLVELSIDILRPYDTDIVLGYESATLSSQLVQQGGDLIDTATQIVHVAKKEIEADYTTNIELAEQSLKTLISQTANEIALSVDRQNESIDRIAVDQSILKQNAEKITMQVTSVTENQTKQSDALKSLEQQTSELKQTANQVEISITGIQNNGVNKVTTKTGVVVDEIGVSVNKSDSEMQSQLSHTGLEVTKIGNRVLTANNQGVKASNLHATTFLIIGKNSRFEDFGNGRTGCFWIGG